jgi:hypothetical protein
MDACIVTSGTGNAFPKDTGNSQAVFGEDHGCTFLVASAQRLTSPAAASALR